MAGAPRRMRTFPSRSRILLAALALAPWLAATPLSAALAPPLAAATRASPEPSRAATSGPPQRTTGAQDLRRARDPLSQFQTFLGRLERGQTSISPTTVGEIGLSIADL